MHKSIFFVVALTLGLACADEEEELAREDIEQALAQSCCGTPEAVSFCESLVPIAAEVIQECPDHGDWYAEVGACNEIDDCVERSRCVEQLPCTQ